MLDRARITLGALVCLLPLVGHAAEAPSKPTFGMALNASVDGEAPIRLVPTATLQLQKTQFELGIGLHPFIRAEQRVWSTEVNVHYYPSGLDRLFSPYLIGRLSYLNVARQTYYPTTYHYMGSNVGYGLMVKGAGRAYMATNVSVGPYTYIRRSENPYAGFESDGLFDEVGLSLAFQFSVGYRF